MHVHQIERKNWHGFFENHFIGALICMKDVCFTSPSEYCIEIKKKFEIETEPQQKANATNSHKNCANIRIYYNGATVLLVLHVRSLKLVCEKRRLSPPHWKILFVWKSEHRTPLPIWMDRKLRLLFAILYTHWLLTYSSILIVSFEFASPIAIHTIFYCVVDCRIFSFQFLLLS